MTRISIKQYIKRKFSKSELKKEIKNIVFQKRLADNCNHDIILLHGGQNYA